jgi:2-polyprenyl-6-hydroxyphenyl methylase/3-demethylubiquinone-9 3-methyltransferase
MSSQPLGMPTAAYFDSQASRWTQRYNCPGHFRERLETALEWLSNETAPLKLLDYGCGSGVLLRELVGRGHSVTGVDVSADMLASARQGLEAARVGADRFKLEQIANNSDGEYLKQYYDGIVCLGVIEYLEQPMELLSRLTGLLRPGGLIILSFPNRASVLRKIEKLVFRFPYPFRRIGLFPHLTQDDSYLNFQKHQFTLREIEQFLREQRMKNGRAMYHVAPASLARLAENPAVGMSVIAEFRMATAQ